MKTRRLFLILAMFALCAQLMTVAGRAVLATSRGVQGADVTLLVQ